MNTDGEHRERPPPAKRTAVRRTLLQAAAVRLFDSHLLEEARGVDTILQKIREAARVPGFWKPPSEDLLHERLGAGTYGAVYRGTRREGGEVAIKTVEITSEEALTNAVCEFLIQDMVYSAYNASATKERWAPVHHPFPTMYGVLGHQCEKRYEMRASMFIFQCGERTTRARFETTMQLASVLCHLHTATDIRFMHRDMHWNNVLRRTKSKRVKLALFSTDNELSLVKGPGAFQRNFDCGPETAIIDFGLAWVQLPDGQVLQPSTNLYPRECAFNSQHDLRQFFVSAYSLFCIDPIQLKPLPQLDAYGTLVADLIDRARTQSSRFALYTSLKTLRGITNNIRCSRSRSTFEAWLADIQTIEPFLEVGGAARWKELYVPFILEFKSVWKEVWKTQKMPSIAHFQYSNAVEITNTPCFEPAAVLSFTAQCWK